MSVYKRDLLLKITTHHFLQWYSSTGSAVSRSIEGQSLSGTEFKHLKLYDVTVFDRMDGFYINTKVSRRHDTLASTIFGVKLLLMSSQTGLHQQREGVIPSWQVSPPLQFFSFIRFKIQALRYVPERACFLIEIIPVNA